MSSSLSVSPSPNGFGHPHADRSPSPHHETPRGPAADTDPHLVRLSPEPAAAPPPQPRPAPRRTARQRLGVGLRRVVGVSLVAAALWWLVMPLMFPVTGDAIVNARTVQVRAPIDGTATELTYDVRDTVAAGQPMARLVNRQLDTSGLTGLTSRRAELVTRRERLDKELAEVTRTEAQCRAEADRYQAAVVENLEAARREAASRAESARVEYDAAVKRFERVQSLAGRGLSELELDAARETQSVCRLRSDSEQATLTKCKGELAAARGGLFLQKDTPHFQQRAAELALRIPQLRAAQKEADDLLAAVAAEIAREQARTDRLSGALALAPVGGVVWTRQGNLGQGVKLNEVVYEVADGGSVFVEAVVHQRYLGAVAAGTPATVNVTGGPSLTGRVRAVRSGRPADNEPTFAFGVPDPDPKKLRVMVELDRGAADPAALIGRHVRVLIADPEAGPCGRAVVWLFAHVRV